MEIILAFITGLTTGGLSCLAVQGGLLASSLANEVEQSLGSGRPAHSRHVAAQKAAKRGRAARRVSAQPVVTLGLSAHPRAARPIVLFLAAKLVAYTVLGFLLGLLGSFLQLTSTMRAVLLVAIGLFMIGTALRMFNVHPIFRYFALEPPSFVTRYIRRKAKGQASDVTPLFLGALTVLIPCGVTQAMMAVAMGTGSPFSGAALMFAFVLGTSPVFFTVAYLATRLGSKLEAGFIRVVAVIVLALGLLSINTGLTLIGSPYSVTNLFQSRAFSISPATAEPRPEDATAPPAIFGQAQESAPVGVFGTPQGPASSDNVIRISVANNGYHPNLAHAKANQPFKLAVVTDKTYSCARAFVIPALGVERILPATGSTLIDVPAQPAGSKLFYSCSMGMYSGVIEIDG